MTPARREGGYRTIARVNPRFRSTEPIGFRHPGSGFLCGMVKRHLAALVVMAQDQCLSGSASHMTAAPWPSAPSSWQRGAATETAAR